MWAIKDGPVFQVGRGSVLVQLAVGVVDIESLGFCYFAYKSEF